MALKARPIYQGSARTNLYRYRSVLKALIAEASEKPRRKDDPLLLQWQAELRNADSEWADLIGREGKE